jgi:hypothetical protein
MKLHILALTLSAAFSLAGLSHANDLQTPQFAHAVQAQTETCTETNVPSQAICPPGSVVTSAGVILTDNPQRQGLGAVINDTTPIFLGRDHTTTIGTSATAMHVPFHACAVTYVVCTTPPPQH